MVAVPVHEPAGADEQTGIAGRGGIEADRQRDADREVCDAARVHRVHRDDRVAPAGDDQLDDLVGNANCAPQVEAGAEIRMEGSVCADESDDISGIWVDCID